MEAGPSLESNTKGENILLEVVKDIKKRTTLDRGKYTLSCERPLHGLGYIWTKENILLLAALYGKEYVNKRGTEQGTIFSSMQANANA